MSERFPKSNDPGVKPPPFRPAWPYRSYSSRVSEFDSTWYASATSRNRSSASGASETSGCSSRASFRNALLMSWSLAPRETPSSS